MHLEEVDIGNSNESRLEAIARNVKKDVIIRDQHYKWQQGMLALDEPSTETYVMCPHDGSSLTLNVHDLQYLILVKPYKPERRERQIRFNPYT
jgi:hypothetical protein